MNVKHGSNQIALYNEGGERDFFYKFEILPARPILVKWIRIHPRKEPVMCPFKLKLS